MTRFIALLALVAIAFGIAGLAVVTERSSAQSLPSGPRFDIECTQTVVPDGTPGSKGEVTCSIRIDVPDPLPLPDEIKIDIVATYTDVDGSQDPSRGDRLQCVQYSVPGTPIPPGSFGPDCP